MNNKNIYLPIIIALSVISGVFISGLMQNGNNSIFNTESVKTNKLNAMLDFISENYVDTINKSELIEKVIPEVLINLDPHSIYIPAKDLEAMNEPLKGNFEGIGIQFNMRHDTLQVLHVISGGPSEKAGLKPGDQIITVDDSIIAGVKISNTDVMKLLKGEKGTAVKLGIQRSKSNELLYFSVKRDKIPIYSVDVAYLGTDNIGYLKISSFSSTTYSEFTSAISDLESRGMEKVIIDLRENSGGIMSAATNIADEFLDNGEMIVYTQGRKNGRSDILATKKRHLCSDLKVAVLIDEFSASASEILAGAIQDNDRGWIIGRRSFGKGLVQEPVSFNDGSALRLTIARYHTPSGRCIQKSYDNGIEEYYKDIYDRYYNGELMEADSIHFIDSLKYFTSGNRVVYGGGGIMPDIFVPFDTLGINKLYTDIQNKNSIYDFSFDYTRDNRSELLTYKDVESISNYLDRTNVFAEFIEHLEETSLDINAKELSECSNILKTQLYATIARNMLNDEGFYPIIHKIDKTFETAFEILESDKKLN
jgi:carboxyl-terminal processing protease